MNTKRTAKISTAVFGGILIFFIGVGAGSAGKAEPASVQTPAPTVTVTAAPPQTTTADDCHTALNLADGVITDGGKALSVISDALGSLSTEGVSAIDSATSQLNGMQAGVKSDRAAYDTAAAKCRADSK